jgi:hypothetical protein
MRSVLTEKDRESDRGAVLSISRREMATMMPMLRKFAQAVGCSVKSCSSFGRSKMLTFEYDENNQRLCIHGDVDGLRSLQTYLDRLIESTPAGQFDHCHLMTPDWGGNELTSTSQDSMAALVHHVKVYCWKGGQAAS